MNSDNTTITDWIFEELQKMSDSSTAFYNKENGEILWLCDFSEDYAELCDEVEENEEKYIRLPDQYDIHEYSIMKKFALEHKDNEISEILLRSLSGKGAFRRFKDKLYVLGIEQEWYAFRDAAYMDIAKVWCGENGLL